jgi:hypothetical protein
VRGDKTFFKAVTVRGCNQAVEVGRNRKKRPNLEWVVRNKPSFLLPLLVNRLTIILSLASLAVFSARAAKPGPGLGPTVKQARKAFRTRDSLKVELIASEPLMASPCAMAFDERGRLYVAENRGYPRGPAGAWSARKVHPPLRPSRRSKQQSNGLRVWRA